MVDQPPLLQERRRQGVLSARLPPPPLPLTFGHASRFKSKLDLKSQVGDAYPPTSSAGSISTTPGHDTDEHLHFFDERFFNDNLFGFLAGRNNNFLCSGSVTAFQLVRDSALSASPFDSLDSAFSCFSLIARSDLIPLFAPTLHKKHAHSIL